MTIGKNLFIILILLFSFLITNITYAVESNEEFATEKSSVKVFNKSGTPEKWQKISYEKQKNGKRV